MIQAPTDAHTTRVTIETARLYHADCLELLQTTSKAPPVYNPATSSLGLPPGILETDTATCYDCPDGLATPVPDGWARQQCDSYTPYDEDTP